MRTQLAELDSSKEAIRLLGCQLNVKLWVSSISDIIININNRLPPPRLWMTYGIYISMRIRSMFVVVWELANKQHNTASGWEASKPTLCTPLVTIPVLARMCAKVNHAPATRPIHDNVMKESGWLSSTWQHITNQDVTQGSLSHNLLWY